MSSGSPRWIWARRRWRRVCGCRTRPSQAGGCRRSVAMPPPPPRCFSWPTGCAAGALATASGSPGRAMLEALIGGQRDPKVLAQLAKRRLRIKLAALEEALRGFFTDHHAVILRMMLDNIDRLSEQIAALDSAIEAAVAPFASQVAQLDEVTGVGV